MSTNKLSCSWLFWVLRVWAGWVSLSGFLCVLGFLVVFFRGCVQCACGAVDVVDSFWYILGNWFGVVGAAFVGSAVISVHEYYLCRDKLASASGGSDPVIRCLPV